MTFTATYSPEDNKLRLSASSRLDAELYARVKAAGFGWAPKQGIFVAPMWTPQRADLCMELAGEIGDEDTSLVDRAEERAERFEGYRENRTEDAHAAKAGVDRIADGIPMGQPILIGHHSERHARKDAERIENGMRRAVKMWETAEYWKYRAAGAIRHAKYKELPAVRARRIKGIEADQRKDIKSNTEAQRFLELWGVEPLTMERALGITNYCHVSACFPLATYPRDLPASQYEGSMSLWSALKGGIITPDQARTIAVRCHERGILARNRWLEHYGFRLEYERAMLAEGGGLKADGFNLQVGGRVLRRGEWLVITKINQRDGVTLSVTVIGHWKSTVAVEEITDYREPAEGDAEKIKAVTKLAPLCNFPGEGFRAIAKDDLKKRYSTWIHTFPATATHGAYRSYSTFKGGGGLDCHDRIGLYITDQKRKDPPALLSPVEPVKIDRQFGDDERPVYRAPEPTEFDAMRDALRSGTAVQVVSAPQLFPTPADLARRMVEAAGVEDGMCVLEPSAGTGNIVRAVLDSVDTEVLAYEINQTLCSSLQRTFPGHKMQVRCKDFLEVTDFMGCYPRVIMNPPFINGADIQHITHAVKFLAPGGRLVAICANGPRQRAALMPLAENSGGYWEDLPAGTFAEQGTGVNAALVVIEA